MAKRSLLLYGKNSVLERLKVNPRTITKIFVKDDFDSRAILELIKINKIPFRRLTLNKLQRFKPHCSLGGVVAEVDNFNYVDFNDLIKRKDFKQTSFIFLDRIFDPQNLGAIIRTAACFGRFSLVIPKHKACEVTETVLHVAQGGENYIRVAMVSNLTNALLKAKAAGFWAVGAVTEKGQPIAKVNLPFPVCLLLGSEGEGLRYGLAKHLDLALNIPMSGAELSFNVTAACAIFCYEISRQKAE